MTPAQSHVGELALRHLDAAYNLGRWLLGNDADASDAVHDAFVRATRSADTYAGGNARAWWLAIVRNCCLAKLANAKRERAHVAIEHVAETHGREVAEAMIAPPDGDDAERTLEAAERRAMLARHIAALSVEFREVLLLREIEEFSYREIADQLSLPIGTVMSRLSRARAQLQHSLRDAEVTHGL